MDSVVVDRLIAGHAQPDASCTERRAAADDLLRRRPELTRVDIARRVGASVRTVERRAAALGLAAPRYQRAPGETRGRIKDLILENPRLSVRRAAVLVGVNQDCARDHYLRLVSNGELPARTEVDNPRWLSYNPYCKEK